MASVQAEYADQRRWTINLANYRIPEAARALQDFVDDMSNWYVSRSRERFWAKGMEQDKINAYMTLYTALVNGVQGGSADDSVYDGGDLSESGKMAWTQAAPESIHLCDYPGSAEESISTKSWKQTWNNVLKLVVMGRACRNTANIKNRQPMGQMFVKADFELAGILSGNHRRRAECKDM